MMTSTDQGKPARRQHKTPCCDCPFARSAIPGWLGGDTPEGYLLGAHGENIITCHVKLGQQCAGGAIYRANVLKMCRSLKVLVLPPSAKVFTTPMEFLDHHRKEAT